MRYSKTWDEILIQALTLIALVTFYRIVWSMNIYHNVILVGRLLFAMITNLLNNCLDILHYQCTKWHIFPGKRLNGKLIVRSLSYFWDFHWVPFHNYERGIGKLVYDKGGHHVGRLYEDNVYIIGKTVNYNSRPYAAYKGVRYTTRDPGQFEVQCQVDITSIIAEYTLMILECDPVITWLHFSNKTSD